MKKRSSLIFMGLGCMALAFGAAAVAGADEASAADAKPASARIEYGYGEKGTSTSEYFKVVASHGAVLTYKEGKNDVSAEPDIEDGTDTYYFKVPKKEINITVGATDEAAETTLKVTVAKGQGNPTKIMCKKAKYEPKATGFEYGNITAETEGVTSGAFTAFVPDTNGSWGDDDFDALYYNPDEDASGKPGYDDYVDDVNNFIRPLLKDGATVIVRPGASGEYTYANKKYVYYEWSANDGKTLALTKKTDTCKTKAAKVKIAKLKKAPTVKVDVVKGTIGITSNKLEYRFAPYDPTTWECKEFGSTWSTDGKKGMKLNDVSTASITCGGIIEVRTAKTDKALYSKTTRIELPSQQAIDLTKINATGTITNGSITAGEEYEWTKDDPAKGGAKWTSMKNGIKFTVKNSAADKQKFYIRKKGVNKTKTVTTFTMPSDIAVFNVSGSSLASPAKELGADTKGAYLTKMSALY